MLIKKIRLKNFKNFKDAELELGDMNVLVGANASGKSNFLQALQFLKDIQVHDLEFLKLIFIGIVIRIS